MPLLILCNNENDGNGKCSISIRYNWMHVYHNSNAYISWFRLSKQVSLSTYVSVIRQILSIYYSRYTGKCSDMLFLERRQCWPRWNHWGREKEHPLEKSMTCNSLSTLIQPLTSGINMWLFVNLKKRLDHCTVEMNILLDKDSHWCHLSVLLHRRLKKHWYWPSWYFTRFLGNFLETETGEVT